MSRVCGCVSVSVLEGVCVLEGVLFVWVWRETYRAPVCV